MFNDDTIAGRSGFPPHPHREMEIVTLMHEGVLTHSDNMGNNRTLEKGYIQRMSAGTGVTHSEMNNGDDTVRLYQLWFYPNQKSLTPTYEEKRFTLDTSDELHLLASPHGNNGSMKLNADVSIYYGTLMKGKEYTVTTSKDNHTLIYVKHGSIAVLDEVLEVKDQARITGESELNITANEDTELIIVVG